MSISSLSVANYNFGCRGRLKQLLLQSTTARHIWLCLQTHLSLLIRPALSPAECTPAIQQHMHVHMHRCTDASAQGLVELDKLPICRQLHNIAHISHLLFSWALLQAHSHSKQLVQITKDLAKLLVRVKEDHVQRTLMHRCTDAQMHRCTDAQMQGSS